MKNRHFSSKSLKYKINYATSLSYPPNLPNPSVWKHHYNIYFLFLFPPSLIIPNLLFSINSSFLPSFLSSSLPSRHSSFHAFILRYFLPFFLPYILPFFPFFTPLFLSYLHPLFFPSFCTYFHPSLFPFSLPSFLPYFLPSFLLSFLPSFTPFFLSYFHPSLFPSFHTSFPSFPASLSLWLALMYESPPGVLAKSLFSLPSHFHALSTTNKFNLFQIWK